MIPLLLLLGASTPGKPVFDPEVVQRKIQSGKIEEAVSALEAEVDANPAHETAWRLLAEAYERAGRDEEAKRAWTSLLRIARQESNRHEARKGIARLLRKELDAERRKDTQHVALQRDPFKIDMPEIDWEGLDEIEDSTYKPPVFPGGPEVPPFAYETEHFTVYSTNERLSKVIGERAEIYLRFMIERLFGGRSWALRFPILVYKDRTDYNNHGGPRGSGGVTFRHLTGKTRAILLYQRADSGRGIWKYGIESVLPHELTHAVINEFFRGRRAPRWLHEAIAGRFEQTRDHYGEAARLSRKVIAGEYFRMRDLFNQPVYPKRISLFYEQAAAVVLYLFETGPEAMHAFLSELAAGHGHDAACAAALGIPKEHAVEEFERRWVEWMKRLYVAELDPKADGTVISQAAKTDDPVALPWVNEKDTIASLESWREVPLELDNFVGVGSSLQDWTVRDGRLLARRPKAEGETFLGLRMEESAPVAVRTTVRCLANPSEGWCWFGYVQLDPDGHDTRVVALAPLRDSTEQTVVGIWSDDLAVYLGDQCTGRFPALPFAEEYPEIESPLALVTVGPVSIGKLEIAPIEKFSKKPVVEAGTKGRSGRRRANRPRRPRRRRRRP